MKKIVFILALLLLSSNCDNKSGDKDNKSLDKKLSVVIVSNSSYDLNHLKNVWTNRMPNYTFTCVTYDTVSVDDIVGKDVVVLFENGNSSSSKRVGDLMALHANNGGNVILGTFYGQGRNNQSGDYAYGDLMAIDPVSGYVNAYTKDTLEVNSNHPLLAGITKLTADYGAGDTLLVNGGKLIEKWKNGDIFAAYTEPSGRILYVSLWPGESDRTTLGETKNDFFRLWANAIRWVFAKDTKSSDFNVNGEDLDAGDNDINTEPTKRTSFQGSGVKY